MKDTRDGWWTHYTGKKQDLNDSSFHVDLLI